MLHIVNGDHTGHKLREGGLPGDILIWREIYPIGPIFDRMDGPEERKERARYLERTLGVSSPDFIRGCESQERALREVGKYEDIVLWFEYDLFDQTMLCFLLDWFSRRSLGRTRIHLLCVGGMPGVPSFRGLGQLTVEQLMSLSGAWERLGEEEIELGSRIWRRYASPNIEDHLDIVRMDTSALPFVKPAFAMHLARLPSPEHGLGIVEQTVLELVRDGLRQPLELFRQTGERLHELGMGDLEFWYRLRTMAARPNALLEVEDTAFFRDASIASPSAQDGVVGLTAWGRELLSGRGDAVPSMRTEEWYGGLHLTERLPWRWDRKEERLVRVEAST